MKSVSFVARSTGLEAAELTARLNTANLPNDKLLALEALDFRLGLDVTSGDWTISLATGKGSAVWSLFPPMIMFVDFSKSDAMRLIELFRLVCFEIKRFERRESYGKHN
jgi:hypothetical protein